MKASTTVLVLTAVFLLGIPGCGSKGSKMVPVRGTVKFVGGTVPQGEVATVSFQPVSAGEGQPIKGAQGTINQDGSFEMFTRKPGDGVMVGRYKVCIIVRKKYMDPKSWVVPQKYVDAKTTPFEVNVEKAISDLKYELDKS